MTARSSQHTMRRLFQFRLRTVLIAVLIIAVTISSWRAILRYRSASLWQNYEEARIARDTAQRTWKVTYEKATRDVQGIETEQQLREQYFAARKTLEDATTALRRFYGISGGRALVTVDPNNGMKTLVSDN